MIIHPSFLGHWKTRMLIKELDDPAAPLYLIRLWAHCQESKSAKFDNLPPVAVAMICEYDGDPEKLNAALINARWLSRDGDSIEVLGWEEHNAQLIANWENGRKGGRPRKNSGSEKSGNSPSKTHGIPMANPTLTDKIRVDKMRVDKNTQAIALLVDAWNDNCGTLPKIDTKRKLNEKRIKGFNRLIKDATAQGVDPVEMLSLSARQVSRMKVWQEERYRIDNLFAGQKYFLYHERELERMENPHTSPSGGNSPFEPFYCSLDTQKKRPFRTGDKIASWSDGTYEVIEKFLSQSMVQTKSGKTIDLTDYRLEQ